jgi:hypothetical protein
VVTALGEYNNKQKKLVKEKTDKTQKGEDNSTKEVTMAVETESPKRCVA